MHQHAANRSAEQRSEQTGTPGEEPVNHDEDDAVNGELAPADDDY
jgi:hypothetical protein